MGRYSRRRHDEDDDELEALPPVAPPPNIVQLILKQPARSKCTPELTASICALIQSGASPTAAASAHSIFPNMFWSWVRWGKQEYDVLPESEPLSQYALFYVAVMTALGLARAAAEQQVWAAKPEIWLTKGGLSGNWSDVVELRIPGADDKPPVESPLKRVSDNQLVQVLDILQEVGAFSIAAEQTVEAD